MTALRLSRRQMLCGALGVGALAGLSAGGRGRDPATAPVPASSRPTTGRVRDFTLTARPVQVDLGGTVVSTWAYGDSIPGTAFRATAGGRVRVAFANDLPAASSVPWHGLAIRNDMDGAPGVTTPEVLPGRAFAFDFVVPMTRLEYTT